MLETRRPKLDMLSESFIDQIVSEALDVLGKKGVLVENNDAIRLLKDAGCECEEQTVLFKENLIEESLKTTPHSIKIYDRSGDLVMNLEDDLLRCSQGHAGQVPLIRRSAVLQETGRDGYFRD